MRLTYLLSVTFLFGCQPQLECKPVETTAVYQVKECKEAEARAEIKKLEERIKDLEERCNPAYGNFQNCDRETVDRWFNAQSPSRIDESWEF